MTKRSNSSDDSHILIGRIGRPRGLKGEFFINSFSESSEAFLKYKNFFLYSESELAPIDFEYLKKQNQKIIGKISDINSPEEAERIKNSDLFLHKNDLPELEDGYYWHELIGMKVINLDGDALGEVIAINNYGSNDMLEVKTKEKKLLIPFVKNRIIFDIDKEKKVINVDWYDSY